MSLTFIRIALHSTASAWHLVCTFAPSIITSLTLGTCYCRRSLLSPLLLSPVGSCVSSLWSMLLCLRVVSLVFSSAYLSNALFSPCLLLCSRENASRESTIVHTPNHISEKVHLFTRRSVRLRYLVWLFTPTLVSSRTSTTIKAALFVLQWNLPASLSATMWVVFLPLLYPPYRLSCYTVLIATSVKASMPLWTANPPVLQCLNLCRYKHWILTASIWNHQKLRRRLEHYVREEIETQENSWIFRVSWT